MAFPAPAYGDGPVAGPVTNFLHQPTRYEIVPPPFLDRMDGGQVQNGLYSIIFRWGDGNKHAYDQEDLTDLFLRYEASKAAAGRRLVTILNPRTNAIEQYVGKMLLPEFNIIGLGVFGMTVTYRALEGY